MQFVDDTILLGSWKYKQTILARIASLTYYAVKKTNRYYK